MHSEGPDKHAPRRWASADFLRGSGPMSVARRFLLAYGMLVVVATLVIGYWVGQQIEDGVLNRTAAVTALYIHSFVAPQVQTLTTDQRLTPGETSQLGQILASTELGQKIVGFRIWSHDGLVLYSPIPGMTGQRFALAGDRARSFQGAVTVDMSDLSDPENVFERQRHYNRLVEMYVPILQDGSGHVLAVAEFYQLPDEIDAEVTNARIRSWALVLLAAIASYFLVAAMVLRASRTIARQQSRLRDQVDELSGLLTQVEDLNARIRQAGAGAEAIAAQEGRRISADLHDGPGQALALALLQFEELQSSTDQIGPQQAHGKLEAARAAINDALDEIRHIAAGLRLPELAPLSVGEVVERAVRDHEKRSGIEVARDIRELPLEAPLAVKIGLFRALQETLSNATRHGKGIAVAVTVWSEADALYLEVSDRGPGFAATKPRSDGGLGLPGLRERTALLGGTFEVVSSPGQGARIRLTWPLAEVTGMAGPELPDGSAA